MEMDYNKILTDEDFMEIKQHGTSDIHFSIIMMIWSYLIFIVLNGTGTENLSFYMLSLDKLYVE